MEWLHADERVCVPDISHRKLLDKTLFVLSRVFPDFFAAQRSSLTHIGKLSWLSYGAKVLERVKGLSLHFQAIQAMVGSAWCRMFP
jgi:hypothetical protein